MKFALIGMAFIAAASLAGPVFAQEAIEDPGYCAQFYPNANCQNYGPGNPYRGPNSYQSRWQSRGDWYGSHARMTRSHSMRHHRHHKYGHRH